MIIIMNFIKSKREMICPYCGKDIHVNDEIGQVEEDVHLGTKFSWDIFWIKETNYIGTYSVYACRSCCKKVKVFQIISDSVVAAVIILWFLYCGYYRIPNSITAFVFLALVIVLIILKKLIRWILRIKKII